eukprot:TRINITY_DN5622_c0_g1_i17.p1 TRINITY_DN5622_c0_g1~~TRINITY_DN5622_c0_g1_i17.p1  ORF type:complete len:132 (+),score=31.62 TRINITY_DN5622_c0_g1_i17:751-1146(+)
MDNHGKFTPKPSEKFLKNKEAQLSAEKAKLLKENEGWKLLEAQLNSSVTSESFLSNELKKFSFQPKKPPENVRFPSSILLEDSLLKLDTLGVRIRQIHSLSFYGNKVFSALALKIRQEELGDRDEIFPTKS